ncbi:MAG: GrpB family protein, partial [Bacilli bacterium]|nr:GrpB family protein [Bacilli bacterium]
FVGQAFHIHIRYLGDWDELYFRDYLRTNENARKNYVKLKEELFISFEHDRNAYTTGKTNYIKYCTKLSRQELRDIYKDK